MSSSAHLSRRLGRSIACALAAALIAVPLASAVGSPGTMTENSATQNPVDVQNPYNQLDPWLYRLLTAQPKLTPADKYGPLDPAIATAIRNHQNTQPAPLVTDNA